MEGAEPEAVHRVRTGSRRLQAMIESTTPSGAFGKLTKARLRQLKKIRRAAGPVRDLDVQRKLLVQWTNGEAGHPLRDQALALDAWLKNQRNGQAQKMLEAIGKPQQRLAELGPLPRFEVGKSAGGADAVAMDFFARAAYAMPHLDGENLHDFRKAAKKARYVAESGGVEPTSVGKALKRGAGCHRRMARLALPAAGCPQGAGRGRTRIKRRARRRGRAALFIRDQHHRKHARTAARRVAGRKAASRPSHRQPEPPHRLKSNQRRDYPPECRRTPRLILVPTPAD